MMHGQRNIKLLLFIPLLISSLVWFWLVTCFFMTRQPLGGQGFTIMLRHTILSRTPLDEWSAWRRDLYPIRYNTHKRQTSMVPAGFEPTISAGERPQTHAVDRAATGIGFWLVTIVQIYWNFPSSQRIFTRNGMSFCMLLERYGRTHRFLYPSTSTSFLTSNSVILLLLLCLFGGIINE